MLSMTVALGAMSAFLLTEFLSTFFHGPEMEEESDQDALAAVSTSSGDGILDLVMAPEIMLDLGGATPSDASLDPSDDSDLQLSGHIVDLVDNPAEDLAEDTFVEPADQVEAAPTDHGYLQPATDPHDLGYILGSEGSDTLIGTDGDDIIISGDAMSDVLAGDGNSDYTPDMFVEQSPDTIEAGSGDDLIRFSIGDVVIGGAGEDLFCYYEPDFDHSETARITDFSKDDDRLVVFVPHGASSEGPVDVDLVCDDRSTSIYLSDSEVPAVDLYYTQGLPTAEVISKVYDHSQNLSEFLAENALDVGASIFIVAYLTDGGVCPSTGQ